MRADQRRARAGSAPRRPFIRISGTISGTRRRRRREPHTRTPVAVGVSASVTSSSLSVRSRWRGGLAADCPLPMADGRFPSPTLTRAHTRPRQTPSTPSPRDMHTSKASNGTRQGGRADAGQSAPIRVGGSGIFVGNARAESRGFLCVGKAPPGVVGRSPELGLVVRLASSRTYPACRTRPLFRVAVSQTPEALTGSVLRVGSKDPKVIAQPRRGLLGLGPPSAFHGRSSERRQVFVDGFVQQPPAEAGANSASAWTTPFRPSQQSRWSSPRRSHP
jgi:hypothetical protein